MIKLFNTLDKIYTSNGDVVLNPTKAVVHKEDNGSFYLNLETGLDEKEYKSEEIEGQTIEGTNFNINVDLSKEYSFDDFKGNITQEGTPTSDNPVNVNVVTGDNTINVFGKNMADTNDRSIGYFNDDGSINTYYSNNSTHFNKYMLVSSDNYATLSFKAKKTLTINRITTYLYDEKYNPIAKGGAFAWGSVTINAGETKVITHFIAGSDITNAKYFRMAIYSVKDENNQDLAINTRFDEYIENFQVEMGRVATTYEPYQSQSYEINLGNIELCKIGDYQDRIYKDNDKWYLEKKIGKVVLDGSEGTWQSWYKTENNNIGFYNYLNAIISNEINNNEEHLNGNAYCNMFSEAANRFDIVDGVAENFKICGRIREASYLAISLSKDKLTDWSSRANAINSFKSWLASNNPIVYYILATPTTTEITDTELINQLESIELIEGINNISSNGNLPIIMNLHYNYRNAYSNVVKYNDYLTSGHIIVANTPQGEQAFRITNIEKTRSKIKIKANHVFYDSVNYLIEDSYVVDKNCNDALDHLNSATSDLSPFTTISNVTNIASFRCVRKSLYEAIQVVLERWGGHLVRDNWTIGIYDSIGQDNGVTIRYAKNLKNITATYNWDDVVTKLMPVGKDGILLNAIDPNVSVYVEALNPYVVPFTKTISFSQDNIEEDNYRDEDGNLDEDAYKQALVEDLYAQATHYVEEHQVPSVNYSLSANVEKISDIGDTIQVTDERLGIDLLTHVISYDYDCILEQYKQLEFGNFTPQLSNLVTTIERKTDEVIRESTATIQVTLNNELQQATSQIWSALSDSYVIYEGDKILIVDTLPKEDATNVIMINNGGIGFSNTGINGQFNSAWTIDNVLNMEQINVINLTADLIKGGTLKLGSNLNQNGQIEVFDESNTLIAELNKNGLKMYGVDGSYVLMNNEVGFAGYDRNNNKIYWVAQDEFHMKKSVVEEEITLCNKLRFIPIEVYNGSTLVNDGIGLVSVAGGGN